MDLMLPGYLHSNRMMADDRSTQVASMMHAYHVGLSPLIAMPPTPVYRDGGADWCGRIAVDSKAFARTSAIFRQAYPTSAFDEERQRKLKSRDAARTRRTNENQEFNELTKLLPIPAAITGQLDKASVVRLTISYLRLRSFCTDLLLPPTNQPKAKHGLPEEDFEVNHGAHLLQALDGFVFAVSADARFLYVSETVSVYLGLSQADMTGRRIFDYTHEQDHLELAQQLGLAPPPFTKKNPLYKSRKNSPTHDDVRTSSLSCQADDGVHDESTNRCFFVRFKSNLARRGTHHKCLGFKVVQITAKLKRREPEPVEAQQPQLLGVLGLVLPLASPSINELFVDSNMFITRLNISLTITFCEARISRITNLSNEDLVNRSLYHICHALDGRKLRRAHDDLLKKGQAVTDYYRLLSGAGGYVWIQTCATVIHNEKNKDEQTVIATNYVLGSVRDSSCAFSIHKEDVERCSGEEQRANESREEGRHLPAGGFKLEERKAEQGDEPSHRPTMSTKRTIDDNDSVEGVLIITPVLNKGDKKAPDVVNSPLYASGCHGAVREKPMGMEHEDFHVGNRRTTSSDRSDEPDDEIRDGPTDGKDQVMHKVYRPWKRIKHTGQVQESNQ